jgi:histidinol-phosphate/aromatic aminotransferase/cobyric acid decarboxylase-like protein
MAHHLFTLGVGSKTYKEKPKSVLQGNALVLTMQDAQKIEAKYKEIEEHRSLLSDYLHLQPLQIVPSIHKTQGHANIKVRFDSKKAAQAFVKELTEKGITSQSRPGKPKTVQAGSYVILTKEDCTKLQDRAQEYSYHSSTAPAA